MAMASGQLAGERMQLEGRERWRYFVPTAICGYLAALCAALIVTSVFLAGMRDAIALTAAGAFGLALSGALGFVFWSAQRRDLVFSEVATSNGALENYRVVRAAALAAGWRILREEPGVRVDAEVQGSTLEAGERVVVRFRGSEVLVASICDPSVGFSLVGRRRCDAHRRRVLECVVPADGGEAGPGCAKPTIA
jgi:hypothetical protein